MKVPVIGKMQFGNPLPTKDAGVLDGGKGLPPYRHVTGNFHIKPKPIGLP